MHRDEDKSGSEHETASRSGEPTQPGGRGERRHPGCACVVKFTAFAWTAPAGPSWTDADNWSQPGHGSGAGDGAGATQGTQGGRLA
jgi:hypothetical protein